MSLRRDFYTALDQIAHDRHEQSTREAEADDLRTARKREQIEQTFAAMFTPTQTPDPTALPTTDGYGWATDLMTQIANHSKENRA